MLKKIDVTMPMHNLIEFSNNYLETSGSLWQYHRDETVLDEDVAIANFHTADKSVSLSKK